MKKRLLVLLILQLAVLSRPLIAEADSPDAMIRFTSEERAVQETQAQPSATESAPAPPPGISADSAVLMDAKTGVVLYSKNMYKLEYPASITKILTALLALEKGENDLAQRVQFKHDDVYGLPWDSSSIAMNEGDTLTLSNALYGMLMASANEVANAIAEHTGGTIDNFVAMMNERAKELGAVHSHFVNPHGLYDPVHYTCAYDMALFMREAVKHPFFDQVISTQSYEIPPTEKQPLERPLHNDDKMIIPGRYYDSDVVGGKTGYTDEAQHTLVTYAKKNGVELIAVVMHEPNMDHYADTAALLDYGFADYRNTCLFDPNGYTGYLAINQPYPDGGESVVTLKVSAEDSLYGFFPNSVNSQTVTLKPEAYPDLNAPIRKGQEVGTLNILYGDILLGSVKLTSAEDLEPIKASPAAAAKNISGPQDTPSGKPAALDTKDTSSGTGIPVLLYVFASIFTAILIIGFLLPKILIRKRKHKT